MTTASDHHGLSDIEVQSYDLLIASVLRVGKVNWRFPPLANSDTLGTLNVKAADEIDATYAAIDELRNDRAFWKRQGEP